MENLISLLYVTFPNIKSAKSICKTLVEERYVACCNIIPGIESIFQSSGKVKEDTEVVAILKTSVDLYYDTTMRIVELHPYKEPCIIQLGSSCKANPEYAAWIASTLGQV